MICCAPNPNEITGICGGLIDYDAGFNELVCTKCGAIYRAQEIAKGVEENKIIRKGSKSKMKVAVNWNKGKKVKEINLENQLGANDIFKPATGIVRPVVSAEPVGKFKIASPVNKKVVVVKEDDKVEVVKEETPIVEEKKEVVEEKVEEPVITEEKVEEVVAPVVEEEEVKTIADPATALETIEKLEEEIHTNSPSRNDKGFKIKVTNQDGTTTEKAVSIQKEELHKSSGVKVRDNSNRHYKNNRSSDMPKRSQVQLTAITFEQLKELDFKYSSTDLEYHKMFFRAEHEKSFPSVSVDFDSIPKDKLLLIAGVDDTSEDVEALKKELEEKDNALVTLRQVSDINATTANELKTENDKLVQELKEAKSKIAALESDNYRLTLELAEDNTEEEEVEETTVEEANEYDNDNFSFISGTLQDFNKLCENLGVEVPENSPSNVVITFKVDEDDNFIRDQNDKIICTAWLNEFPIDSLRFEHEGAKEQ